MTPPPSGVARALARLLDWDATASIGVSKRLAPSAAARTALTAVAHSGDGVLWVGIGALGLACGSAQTRRLVARAGLGVLIASGAVGLVKRTVRRQRPALPEEAVLPLWAAHDQHAFPSGHTARLLATAVVVRDTHPVAGAALSAWSLAVGLARIALGAHYLLDVTVGLVVGGWSGWLARRLTAAAKERDARP